MNRGSATGMPSLHFTDGNTSSQKAYELPKPTECSRSGSFRLLRSVQGFPGTSGARAISKDIMKSHQTTSIPSEQHWTVPLGQALYCHSDVMASSYGSAGLQTHRRTCSVHAVYVSVALALPPVSLPLGSRKRETPAGRELTSPPPREILSRKIKGGGIPDGRQGSFKEGSGGTARKEVRWAPRCDRG